MMRQLCVGLHSVVKEKKSLCVLPTNVAHDTLKVKLDWIYKQYFILDYILQLIYIRM